MIDSDIQKLSPGAVISLYVLDATALGGAVTRFHPGTNELKSSVVWQGATYSPFPIEADGFEWSGKGTLPRPTIKVANVDRLVGALVRDYADLVGAKVTRKRTLVKYLDAVNFTGGVNPDANPNAHFADEVYFIERKASENKIFIEFELTASWDVQGVMLPRRQAIQNVCGWSYRSAECGYAGGAVADINDAPTTVLANDKCGKRLASCKLRFGAYAELPFGGFPGVGLIR